MKVIRSMARLQLNLRQQSLVLEAMESFRRSLKGGNQERFDQIMDKVKGKAKYYDSEEMIRITQSLRKYSKILFVLRADYETRIEFHKLANRVDKAREMHQAKFLAFKRKEAPTAGTVHAS